MKSVRDIPTLENIPVLVRISQVVNEVRLAEALPTIKFLIEKNARVILVTHVSGKGNESARPIYDLVKTKIPLLVFCDDVIGEKARAAVRDLPPRGVLMLENVRRYAGEEKNDPEFAKELASLADVFVQDAFDTCHREHASMVSVPSLLPSYAGFTLQKEVEELSRALRPQHPSLAIIAGAKFATKEPVINALLASYDHVFVGGALANDFILAKGYPVGASLVSEEGQDRIRELVKNPKIVAPVDSVVAKKGQERKDGRVASLKEVQDDEMILDAGPATAAALTELVNKAKTVVWNGPLGLFEHGYNDATRAVAHAIGNANTYSIIGGGDTIAALEDDSSLSRFSFVSTGGGAMLDFLAYGTLPGIAALR